MKIELSVSNHSYHPGTWLLYQVLSTWARNSISLFLLAVDPYSLIFVYEEVLDSNIESEDSKKIREEKKSTLRFWIDLPV